MALRRAQWVLWRAGIDPRRLVFIDETWAKTNMTRLRGRAPRGDRLVAKVPHGHWNTTTLIGALGIEGVRCSTVVDGPVNREIFEAFVEQVLCPVLRPGDVVVMDNLSSHKGPKVGRLVESRGASLVYLPPYSPDLMPVERLWQWLRQQVTALHCHRDEDERRERLASFEALLNDEPAQVHARLRPKTRLDLQEEKLRV